MRRKRGSGCQACAAEIARLRAGLAEMHQAASLRIQLAEDEKRAIEERFTQVLAELKATRKLSGINLAAITAAAPETLPN